MLVYSFHVFVSVGQIYITSGELELTVAVMDI